MSSSRSSRHRIHPIHEPPKAHFPHASGPSTTRWTKPNSVPFHCKLFRVCCFVSAKSPDLQIGRPSRQGAMVAVGWLRPMQRTRRSASLQVRTLPKAWPHCRSYGTRVYELHDEHGLPFLFSSFCFSSAKDRSAFRPQAHNRIMAYIFIGRANRNRYESTARFAENAMCFM